MDINEILLSLPVAAFANWQAVETLHHGSVFESFRAKMEARGGWLGEMFSCPFCLSHWTGFIMAAFTCMRYVDWSTVKPSDIPTLILMWLAVTRISNVANDMTKGYNRTPKGNTEEITTIVEELKEKTSGDKSE